MSSFGKRLATCIEAMATNQAEVARRAGIKPSSVSDWVHDKTQTEQLKAEPLLKAAAFLKVNPMWLLLGKGAKDSTAGAALEARELPAPAYAVDPWPFPSVARRRFNALPDRQQGIIEGYMDRVISTWEAEQPSSQTINGA